MKIAYVSHTRFPNQKAHGHQIARVCEALITLGHEVTLVAPDVHNPVRKDHVEYYDLKTAFHADHLPTFDALHSRAIPGRFAFAFTMHSYRGSLREYFADRSFDLLYARSPQVVGVLVKTGIPVLLELHTLPSIGRSRFVALCNKCRRIVCLTSPMRDQLVSWGVRKNIVIVEGDAVDLARFATLPSPKKARHHFGVPEGRPVVGYVGSLVTMDHIGKGVDVLLQAAAILRSSNTPVFVFVVGGPEEYIAKLRVLVIDAGLRDDDVFFYGPVATALVPDAIAACDICVYPAPTSNKPYFLRDTSPLKLFEYLAAGRPVVCADLPPLHDVFSKDIVRFCHPGSAASLAGGISDVLEHPKEALDRVERGRKIVKEHTWEKRMARILRELKIKN